MGLPLASALALGTSSPLIAQQPGAVQLTRQLGTVKSIAEGSLVIAPDNGSDVNVSVGPGAKTLRLEPGQTDLKAAEPIQFDEIQPGDRVLVRGKASEDGKSFAATMVIAIKKASIEQKQSREREDWQKRGLGGLVKTVDSKTNTVTISTRTPSGTKPVAVRIAPATIIKRYAANSVRYDDAKPGKLGDIKPGDQFRGRGKRSADGNEFEAEEIITGTFRNIAG